MGIVPGSMKVAVAMHDEEGKVRKVSRGTGADENSPSEKFAITKNVMTP